MSDDFAPSVKGLLNALQKGSLSTQRICKIASNGSTAQMLDTLEPANALDRSLVSCQVRIKDAYALSTKVLGRRFTEAVANDHLCTSRIQGLTINLLDNLMNLNDYFLDPEAFDYGSFRYLQREAERCCDQTLHAMGRVHQEMAKASIQLQSKAPTDDRAQLSSMRGLGIVPVSSIPTPTLSLPHPRTNSTVPTEPPPLPNSEVWTTRKPVAMSRPTISEHASGLNGTMTVNEPNVPTGTSYGSFTPATPEPPRTPALDHVQRDKSRSPRVDAQESQKNTDPEIPGEAFIERDEIMKQMARNEELLEKRRRSKMFFMEESRRNTLGSPVSPHPNSSTNSTPLLLGTSFVISPVQTVAPNAQFLMTKAQDRDDGSPSISPIMSRNSRGSSINVERPSSTVAQDRDSFLRPDSLVLQRQDSEILIFGSPESPPLSEGRQSGVDNWGPLAHTLKLPNFGVGVEEGLEVVGRVDDDPEKMLANEDRGQPTPTLSVQSADCHMRHDASFYKYGGFCEAARMILRGEEGALKVIKRPAGVYGGSMVISKKCIKCTFEVGFETWEKDLARDRSGIYEAGDIRFRQRFLSKSHMDMDTIEPVYACVFCVEDSSTIEDHDATVFFSHVQLLRHIQRHPRPLKYVEGMKVIYGHQPDALDFDLHFKTMDCKPHPFRDISAKLAARPSGYALVNHRPRAKGYRDRDPDKQPTLEFAIGAKIVGITYPDKYNGAWCFGYHNGERASFPANTVQLEPPSKEDVTMNPKSNFTVTAKWDHKPKDSNKGGWLSFSKKDKIIHVGFAYQDHWCWTGQNSKGKWGIFPASFVEGLVEIPRAAPGGLSPGGLSPAKKERTASSGSASGRSGTLSGSAPIPIAGSESVSPSSPTPGHHWGSLGKLSFRRRTTLESTSNGSDGGRSPG